MTKRPVPSLFAVLLLFLGGSIWAEPLSPDFVAAHSEATIVSIRCLGNTRTKAFVIEDAAGLRIGMRVADIDPEAVPRRLLNTGLFSGVTLSANAEGDAVDLWIAVNEKLTIVILPTLSYSKESWSVGAKLLDYNFLGARHVLSLGGAVSDLGLSGQLNYSYPKVGGSKLDLHGLCTYQNSMEEVEALDSSWSFSFPVKTVLGGVTLVFPSWLPSLKADINLGVTYKGVSSGDAISLGQSAASMIATVGSDFLIFDGQHSRDYYKSGPKARIGYSHDFVLQGSADAYDSVRVKVQEQFPLFLDGFVSLGAMADWTTRPLVYWNYLAGPGFRSLPSELSYAGTDAAVYGAFDVPISRLSWSVITLGLFYEAGFYVTGSEGEYAYFFHGPGMSYSINLIGGTASPFQLYLAYNIPEGAPEFGLSAGFSF